MLAAIVRPMLLLLAFGAVDGRRLGFSPHAIATVSRGIVNPPDLVPTLMHSFFSVHTASEAAHRLSSDFKHFVDGTPLRLTDQLRIKDHLPFHDKLKATLGRERTMALDLMWDDFHVLLRCVAPQVDVALISWTMFDKSVRVLQLTSLTQEERALHALQAVGEVDALTGVRDLLETAKLQDAPECSRAQVARDRLIHELDENIAEGVSTVALWARDADGLSAETVHSLSIVSGVDCVRPEAPCVAMSHQECMESCTAEPWCSGATMTSPKDEQLAAGIAGVAGAATIAGTAAEANASRHAGAAQQLCCKGAELDAVRKPGASCFNSELLAAANVDMVPYLAEQGLQVRDLSSAGLGPRPSWAPSIDALSTEKLSGLGLWFLLGSDIVAKRVLVPEEQLVNISTDMAASAPASAATSSGVRQRDPCTTLSEGALPEARVFSTEAEAQHRQQYAPHDSHDAFEAGVALRGGGAGGGGGSAVAALDLSFVSGWDLDFLGSGTASFDGGAAGEVSFSDSSLNQKRIENSEQPGTKRGGFQDSPRARRAAQKLAALAAQKVRGYSTPSAAVIAVRILRGTMGIDGVLAQMGFSCDLAAAAIPGNHQSVASLKQWLICAADVIGLARVMQTLFNEVSALEHAKALTPLSHAAAVNALLGLALYAKMGYDMLEAGKDFNSSTLLVEAQIEDQFRQLGKDLGRSVGRSPGAGAARAGRSSVQPAPVPASSSSSGTATAPAGSSSSGGSPSSSGSAAAASSSSSGGGFSGSPASPEIAAASSSGGGSSGSAASSAGAAASSPGGASSGGASGGAASSSSGGGSSGSGASASASGAGSVAVHVAPVVVQDVQVDAALD